MTKLYPTRQISSKSGESPDYVIRDGKLYRTVSHPDGWSDQPDYEIRSDGKIYRILTDAIRTPDAPFYEFHHILIYRTAAHPDGLSKEPDYYISD